jgi:hypothetical protein
MLYGAGAETSGDALDAGVRRVLEDGYDVDLSAVRIHDNALADEFTRSHGADAVTSGGHIYFRAGAYRPSTTSGMRLLAHEVAHTVQQAQGARAARFWEYAADRAADDLIAGQSARIGGTLDAVRPSTPGAPLVIQRHESFEHRALGDLPTDQIFALAGGDKRNEVIERQTELMKMWQQDPKKVTVDQITDLCRWMKDFPPIRLRESGLLVTYGELNALPDYLANAHSIDSCPESVLLPVLQVIRQESYQRLNLLRGRKTNDQFKGAPFPPSRYSIDLIDKIYDSWDLDDLTRSMGIGGTDHYTGLLARNACHFAPFTWHRWQASYLMARGYAEQAHGESNSSKKAELTRLAWLFHGYADHFLQDSFAAGHLINKTLVMQWFIEWAGNKSLLPVEDWDFIKNMTPGNQPAFAGRNLYDPKFAGPSNDPQTVEELATYDARRAATGVKEYTIDKNTTDVATAYQQYLTLLSSVIAQTASNQIHDHFNNNSVWFKSSTSTTAYKVYGDNTLFTGEDGRDGAVRTSEAAVLSRESIRELLARGKTPIEATSIRSLFPTAVGDDANSIKPIQEWVDSKKNWAVSEIFENNITFWLKRVATQTFPRIVNLSQDQDFANLWYTSLPDTGYKTVDMAATGTNVYAGSMGRVFELDPMNGKVCKELKFAGGYETHLATDGKTLFIGCNGYVYGVHLNDFSKVAWTTPVLGRSWNMVNVLYSHGKLFAGSNTYAMELDPHTGKMKNSISVSNNTGSEVRLSTDGRTLYIGCHGYAYAVRLDDWSKTLWEASMPHKTWSNVSVLRVGLTLYAGSNGTAIQLDPATGKRLNEMNLTRSVAEEVHLAATMDMLVAGCNGYVTGIDVKDWSKAAWSTPMSGVGWKEVDVRSRNGVVFAGSNGYIHRLDTKSGKMLNAIELGFKAGVGDYTTQLALNEHGKLYIGMHGYAYAMSGMS